MAQDLSLKFKYNTYSFGPSHALSWICKYQILDGDDEILAGQRSSDSKTTAEYSVRSECDLFLRKRSAADDAVALQRLSGIANAVGPFPNIGSATVDTPKVAVEPNPVASQSDTFYSLMQSEMSELGDAEAISVMMANHVKLLVSMCANLRHIPVPSRLTFDVYRKLVGPLIQRACFDEALAAAHNAIMHALTGNGESVAPSTRIKARVAYETLQRKRIFKMRKGEESPELPPFSEYLTAFDIVNRIHARQKTAAWRAKQEYKLSIPLPKLALQVCTSTEAAAKLHNAKMHAINGNSWLVPLLISLLLGVSNAGYVKTVTALSGWSTLNGLWGSTAVLQALDNRNDIIFTDPTNATYARVGKTAYVPPESIVAYEIGLNPPAFDGIGWWFYQAEDCYTQVGFFPHNFESSVIRLGATVGMAMSTMVDAWGSGTDYDYDMHYARDLIAGCHKLPGNAGTCFDSTGVYGGRDPVANPLRGQFTMHQPFLCVKWINYGGNSFTGQGSLRFRVVQSGKQAGGYDEVLQAKNNAAQHALNGNQYSHGNIMNTPRDALKTRKTRKSIARDRRFTSFMAKSGIKGKAKDYFLQMVDGFHDENFQIAPQPSENTDRTVVIVNPATVTVGKPTDIAEGEKWDCHIMMSPFFTHDPLLPAHNGMSLDEVPNGNYVCGSTYTYAANAGTYTADLAYTAGALHGVAFVPVGLCGVAVPSGSNTFGTGVEGSASEFPQDARPFQVPVPIDFMRGEHRVVGQAFEVHNTSPVLDKPGSVITYRTPFEVEMEAASGVNTGASTAFKNGALFQRIPRNQAEVRLLKDAKMWEAADGCYVVGRPVGEPAFHRPAFAVPLLRQDNVELMDTEGGAPTAVVVGLVRVTVAGGIGGKTITALPIVSSIHKWDFSGAYFAGLDAATTLTIDVNMFVEHVPQAALPSDSVFARMAQLPPYKPPKLFPLLQKVLRALPPGVPVAMNDWEVWWDRVCDLVMVASPALDGVVPGAGKAVASGAAAAKQIPKIAKKVKEIAAEVRKDHKAKGKPKGKSSKN